MQIMESSHNVGGGGPVDPYDKYRVEPIGQRESKGQIPHHPDPEKTPKEKLKFAAYLLTLFQKAVNFFIEKHQKSAMTQGNLNDLIAFRGSFELLKKEDRSQDVKFLNNLSKTWIALLEESLHFENDEIQSKFRLLRKKILTYPDNAPHSFGYYLSQNAGQKWVPFPYMELIQKIHREHEKNPEGSAITEWTVLLDEIIALLK